MNKSKFKEKVLKNKNDVFLSKYISRKISIRISYLLVNKFPKITPNQVSLFAFLLSIFGILFFIFFNSYLYAAIGSIILFIGNIFDHIDGEIARYKETKSITGIFLEASFDLIILALIFISLTFFIYRVMDNYKILFFGLFAVTSFLLQQLTKINYDWAFFLAGKNRSDISTSVLRKIKCDNNSTNQFIISAASKIDEIQKRFIFYGINIIFGVLIMSLIDFTFRPMIYLWDFPITGLTLFLVFYSMTFPFFFFNLITNYYRTKLFEK